MTAPTANPKGIVDTLTVRRLKSGKLRHRTRIVFEPGEIYKDAVLEGKLADEPGWQDTLLAAIRERFDVGELPEPRWHGKQGA